MSTIQLSEDLLVDIQKSLMTHDPQAQDVGVATQYLAAVIGLLVANFKSHDDKEKSRLLQQLFDFADRVMRDNLDLESQQQQSDDAMGIWRPDNNQ